MKGRVAGGGSLFHRVFLRFLLALAAGFVLLLPLVHLLQLRMLDERRRDLREEATWLAAHLAPGGDRAEAARAWGRAHSAVRLTFFDAAGALVADSRPERRRLDLAELRAGGRSAVPYAVAPLPGGGWLALSRPGAAAFPHGYHWEVAAIAAVVLALAVAMLYPWVRSLDRAFARLAELAREVSAGHFGRTVGIARRDQLGTLIVAFDDMSRRLAEAERLHARLLHDVSHELRSPLGRIQALAETIVHRPAEVGEHVRGIEQEVALLDRLVGDLLDAARIEAAPVAARLERFALRAWAEETSRRLAPRARGAGVAWTARLPERDVDVAGDPQRLTQAVANLVDNAVAALDGRAGSIELGVEIGDDEGWSVTVADDGPGIPAADLPHVFRRFYRADPHRDRRRGGVGLGLSLVKAIARAHGGDVAIASVIGEGTVVTLRLPCRPPEGNPP